MPPRKSIPCWLRRLSIVTVMSIPRGYRQIIAPTLYFLPLSHCQTREELSKELHFFFFKCFEKALILQRLTYVEAPPSTNESEAFPYEPAAAYIRSSRAGGAQSTLDLGVGGTEGRGDGGTQRWALGAIGANEGWKQPFPILEQKEEKNMAKKSEKLRSREKKEWKLVKTMFFNFVTQWESGQKKKRNQKKRKPRTSQCNDCRYICT